MGVYKLQTLEANIIDNNINSLKDEIISLKDMVIKRLQEENERLHDKCQQWENSAIPDSVQDSGLESTVTSILSDIDDKVESRKVGDSHRIGKSNNRTKKTIIRFINRKYCKKALLKRKQFERIDLKKHQFVSGIGIFVSENLTV